jgi:hypothetical protein
MDTDRAIQLLAIALSFARMITNPAMNRGHRVILHNLLPSLFIVAGLHQGQPGLDIFPGRASMIAGRQKVFIFGAMATHRASALIVSLQVGREGYVCGFIDHRLVLGALTEHEHPLFTQLFSLLIVI